MAFVESGCDSLGQNSKLMFNEDYKSMIDEVKVRDSWLFDRYKYKKVPIDGGEETLSIDKKSENPTPKANKENLTPKVEEASGQPQEPVSEVVESKEGKPGGIYVPDHFNTLKNYIPIEYDPLPPVEPIIKNGKLD